MIQDFTFGHLAPQPRGAIDLVTVASPTATPPNEDPGQIILAKLRRAVRRMANPATQQRMRNRRWGRRVQLSMSNIGTFNAALPLQNCQGCAVHGCCSSPRRWDK